jgi:hypothetical protein
MDQNRKPRHKLMHLWPTDLRQGNPKHMMDKRQPLQQMLPEKLDTHMWKTKTWSKMNSKWIKDLNIRPETLKQLQKAVGNILEQIGIVNDSLNRTQKF